MPEKEIGVQQAIVGYCNLKGILVHSSADGVPFFGNWPLITKLKSINAILPGWPDLTIPYCRNGKAGLYLELKSLTGRITPCQAEMLERLQAEGYEAKVVHGFDEAIKTIENYLKGRETAPRSVRGPSNFNE